MRRSLALTPLSHDHHQALVIAQRLRRADADGAAAARDGLLAYWTDHGDLHFRVEEEQLFPAWAVHGDARHPLVLRALDEHARLRRGISEVADVPEPPPEALRELGELLGTHVRMEERELFPLIEQTLPEAELQALGRTLAAAGVGD